DISSPGAALCLSLMPGGATLAQAYGSAPLRSPDKAFTPPSGIPGLRCAEPGYASLRTSHQT
ncbi:hypothetical protein, partial [Klebsiella pneumoniae]|uniref:hypothetical protein n=1 Tax=Klebsiella pneumoniae TaxID=573 RepID=UPI001D0D20FB